VQLYSIPVIVSALIFGLAGVSVTSASALILKAGTYFVYGPNGDLPELIGVAMFGIVVLLSVSLARIKLDLDNSSLKLGKKSDELDLHARRLKIINETGNKLSKSLSIKEICELATKTVCDLYGINQAILCTYNQAGLEMQASHGADFPTNDLNKFYHLIKAELKTFEPFVMNDRNFLNKYNSFFVCEIDDSEERIGFIAGFSDKPLSFNEDEKNTLDILAEEIGIAIRNCTLRQAMENRAAMLENLVDVSKTLSGTFRMKKIYSKLASISLNALDAIGCSVIIFNEETESANVVASASKEKEIEVEAEKDPAVIRSIKKKRLTLQKSKDSLVCSIPMIFEGSALGTLHFSFSPERKSLKPHEKTLGRAIANQSAVLINRAKVYEKLKKSAKEATSLAEAGSLLISKTSLDDRLVVLTEKLTEILRISKAAVFLIKDGSVYPTVAFGLDHEELLVFKKAVGRQSQIFPGLSQALSKKNPTVLLNSQIKDSRDLLEFLKIKSMLVMPLIFKSNVIGVSFFWERGEYTRFEKEQVELAQKLTEYTSVAIHTAELYEKIKDLKEESEERAQNLRALLDISQIISSPLRTKTVLRRTIDQVRKLFKAESAALLLYDNMSSSLVPQVAVGFNEEDIALLAVKPGEGLSGNVFMSRKARIFGDLMHFRENHKISKINQSLNSVSIAPLIARGRCLGVISVYSKSRSAFDQKSLELLSIFASQVALAIDTASLYEEERKVAETLQRSLLPDLLPEMPGVDIGVLYVPAHLEADIGGDYYDFVILGENKFGIVVGDVCGKGIDAAADTAMARYYLQAFATIYRDPSTVLHYINQVVLSQSKDPQLITMIYAVFDMEKMELKYANAGHPPPFIVNGQDSRIVQMETTGPIVGASAEANYVTRRMTIHPEDIIFLYTDGLTEAKKGLALFGEERLSSLMLKNSNTKNMDNLLQKIYSSVQTWTGGQLQDDMAMVGLKVRRLGNKG
jgi:serine phosphatase RsbU (regulator of sigma subunit)